MLGRPDPLFFTKGRLRQTRREVYFLIDRSSSFRSCKFHEVKSKQKIAALAFVFGTDTAKNYENVDR